MVNRIAITEHKKWKPKRQEIPNMAHSKAKIVAGPNSTCKIIGCGKNEIFLKENSTDTSTLRTNQLLNRCETFKQTRNINRDRSNTISIFNTLPVTFFHNPVLVHRTRCFFSSFTINRPLVCLKKLASSCHAE